MDDEDEISENVEDSDDVLEPDDGDRSDTIGGDSRDNDVLTFNNVLKIT